MNTRRRFVTASAAACLAAPAIFAQGSPAKRLRVAVMGLGRGKDHVAAWMQVPDVEIAALCEVDRRQIAPTLKTVSAAGQQSTPVTLTDFRRALDDPSIDVLSIAAPNFWHAPATILACQAGKHVYVEKPGSHTAREGELMTAAAEKHRRLVQQGTQRRSLPAIREAVQRLKEGAIGKVRSARCWYDNQRPTIGRGRECAPPDWLDWTMWQGPVTERPCRDNLVPYHWHWRWHYGGGELANNGVHALDLALWGLSEAHGAPLHPRRITCNGGRYHYDDDQETPDTTFAAFDFGPCSAFWDGSSCHKRNAGESHAMVTFYGDAGTLGMSSSGYRLYELSGREIHKNEPSFSDVPHFQNLAAAIRDGQPLHCPVEEGQRSTLLCHLGNIAYRSGHALELDADKKQLRGAADAARALWSKEYRKGWDLA